MAVGRISPEADIGGLSPNDGLEKNRDLNVGQIGAHVIMETISDIAKQQRKSDVHQHAKLDDLGRRFEVAERVLAHIARLSALFDRLKTRFR